MHLDKTMNKNAGRGLNRWRVAGWSAAVLILLLPLVAMQFTDEVNWSTADFFLAAGLLAGVGIPFELAVRKTADIAYRAGAGVALVAVFLLVWVNGAVGVIGSENNSANLMYGGVLAIGIIGAAIVRFRAGGMAHTLFAMAGAQALVAIIALIGRLGAPESGPLEIIAVNGFFVALFVGSALLFRQVTQANIE